MEQWEMVELLQKLNAQLSQLLDDVFKSPLFNAGPEMDNEVEALRHAMAIRLNLLENALARRGILKAGNDVEVLRLDIRIRELLGSGVADPDDVVVSQVQ